MATPQQMVLQVKCQPQEVVGTIREACRTFAIQDDPLQPQAPAGTAIRLWVWRNRFWLILRGTGISVFTPVLWCITTRRDLATVIDARIGMHPLILVALSAWWLLVSVFFVVALIVGTASSEVAVGLLVGVVLGAGGLIGSRLGILLRGQILFDFLSAHLRDVVIGAKQSA